MRTSVRTVFRPLAYVALFFALGLIPGLLVKMGAARWLLGLAPLWTLGWYAAMLHRLAVVRPNGAFQEDTLVERQRRFLEIFIPSVTAFVLFPALADRWFGATGGYVPESLILMLGFVAASGLPALRMVGPDD